jgi:FtsP/CotA-like multicopper oxidase with cupredoxin domain
MVVRKFSNLVLSLILVTSFLFGISPQAQAQTQTPPPPQNVDGLTYKAGRITPAERLAAAKHAKKFGLLPGVAGAGGQPAALDPGGIPHYFGPYANYANSPMPKGPVGAIVLDSGGSGYTAPAVTISDVYGTGSGAIATASVEDGIITEITLLDGGSDYSDPLVSIEDPSGAGASATASLGEDLTGGIRKFVDSLPGLNADGANNLGQYLPVAIPDTTSFPEADYYEIELGQYTEQMHSDLPTTTLRGYRQTNTTDATVGQFHYLGPLIIAQKDRPVRIKFTNNLPTGEAGDLFIPVDTTVMGAGPGPKDAMGDECDPMMELMPGMLPCEPYSQNRATLHLHGGLTTWISDGTPHQWTTPAGEDTQYPEGVSVQYVPDMWFLGGNVITDTVGQTTPPVPGATNKPGDGTLTFYYNNQQSARLMFYHDHSHGITRLNVYAGEAGGYLLTDKIEQDLINGTNESGVNPGFVQALPGYGIPLILQDKTYVDASTIAAQDPTWNYGITPGSPRTGDLWLPSVYMPAQNPYDLSGASAFGRWQYGPWFWPPTSGLNHQPVENEYYDPDCDPEVQWCEPPLRPDVPRPSMGMESFMDTPLVNGTAYPYLEVEPTVVRFRVLNAADDRFFNLHMYVADPEVVTADGRRNTEVKMVPALATPGFPATWSTDGRAGGVPDPATAGPAWIQIGTEGGFLPEPVVIPPQPINWNMNATAFNVGNVTDHSLLLGVAERADVLVDFSQYAGKTLILYNDAPAAFPALDPRYDYYTGDPNQTDTGGAPTTQPGFGPNTRTIMQIRVRPADVAGDAVSSVSVINGGSNYLFAPSVEFSGGEGLGAAATATCAIDKITVVNLGSGYVTPPLVKISGGGGTGATAIAKISAGRVVGIQVTNKGSGYSSAPTVEILRGPYSLWMPYVAGGLGGGGGVDTTTARAVATLTVNAITLTDGGAGYTAVPDVKLLSGGGSGAKAFANLPAGNSYDLAALENIFTKTDVKNGVFEAGQDRIIIPQAAYNKAYDASFPGDTRAYVKLHDFTKSFFNGPLNSLTVTAQGTGYTVPPTVTISGGGGSGAIAQATISAGAVISLTLTDPGTGYISAPLVTITGDGAGARAVANGFTLPLQPKAIHDEMGAAFDEYGRMSGFLGLELPVVNSLNQNMVLYGYASPPVEIMKASMTQLGTLGDGTQIWKITQNGVDTHPIHFHLFNVQVINRVAWDGALLPPEPNELGWKETVRVNPLEHAIVAMRPVAPTQPFDLPNSLRLIDPTLPAGVTLKGGPNGFIDPSGNAAPVVNHVVNFGWEYVWHCHILSHEEMDMMHSMSLAVAPRLPLDLQAAYTSPNVTLTWMDNSLNETGFIVERASSPDGPWDVLSSSIPAVDGTGTLVTFIDGTVTSGVDYYYRVSATNVVGDTTVYAPPAVGYPTTTVSSEPTTPVFISVP